MVKLKKATYNEVSTIMNIIEQAKLHLKEQGIDQWQDGYPNGETVQEDIDKGVGYCIFCEKQVAGYVCISFETEKDYEQIEGSWNKEEPYVVVHRFAMSDEFRGKHLTQDIFSSIETMGLDQKCSSIRIDTHENNKKMQYVLQKNSFSYCGIVFISGGKRLAFDKILQYC